MNKEQREYAAMMYAKANDASKKIISILNEQGLDSEACIVALLKASAIVLETYAHIGGDADSLEGQMKDMIGLAREEARNLIKRSGMPKSFDNQSN